MWIFRFFLFGFPSDKFRQFELLTKEMIDVSLAEVIERFRQREHSSRTPDQTPTSGTHGTYLNKMLNCKTDHPVHLSIRDDVLKNLSICRTLGRCGSSRTTALAPGKRTRGRSSLSVPSRTFGDSTITSSYAPDSYRAATTASSRRASSPCGRTTKTGAAAGESYLHACGAPFPSDHQTSFRWLINLDKKQRVGCLDNFWLEVMLCLIGETFDDHSKYVNGAVVSVRNKGDKIGMWLGDASQQSSIMTIGKMVKERLGIDARVSE